MVPGARVGGTANAGVGTGTLAAAYLSCIDAYACCRARGPLRLVAIGSGVGANALIARGKLVCLGEDDLEAFSIHGVDELAGCEIREQRGRCGSVSLGALDVHDPDVDVGHVGGHFEHALENDLLHGDFVTYTVRYIYVLRVIDAGGALQCAAIYDID